MLAPVGDDATRTGLPMPTDPLGLARVTQPFLPDSPRPFTAEPVAGGVVLAALIMVGLLIAGLGLPVLAGAVVVAGSGVGLALGSRRLRRQVERYQRDTEEVIRLLARGHHDRARTLLEPWCVGPATPLRVHALHNLAWTHLVQGQHARAVAVMALGEATGARVRADMLHRTRAANLALAHALAGSLAAAELWLVEAAARASRRGLPSDHAMLLYARAVLACRRGQPADAARELADGWPELEALLEGMTARPVRVVRAFAMLAADPRDAGRAVDLLPRPTFPGEYDFLGAAWPELAAFLVTHGLASPRGTPPDVA